jgi:YesN/AraC family two-component response regulator
MSAAKILVADDHKVNRELLQLHLVHCGFQVVLANDGEQCLAYANAHVPDLILLDIRMPILDGFETCVQLKENSLTRDIPVIFITSFSAIDDKLRGFSVGCVDYVTKPIDLREVLARVTTHLSQRRFLLDLQQRLAQLEQEPNLDTLQLEEDDPNMALVYAARDRLLNSLQEPPTLEQLASELATNRTFLNQAFRAHMGMSTFEYLRQQRLIIGGQKLRESDDSIKSIAIDLGYKHSRDFSQAFKKYYGVTPTVYRSTRPCKK